MLTEEHFEFSPQYLAGLLILFSLKSASQFTPFGPFSIESLAAVQVLGLVVWTKKALGGLYKWPQLNWTGVS